MAWTQEKINEVYAKVRMLAATDEGFRAELLNDTNAAILRVAGESLPESYNVKIIENDPAYSAIFVLPPMIYGELSADDLGNIAGGSSCGGSFEACGGQVLK